MKRPTKKKSDSRPKKKLAARPKTKSKPKPKSRPKKKSPAKKPSPKGKGKKPAPLGDQLGKVVAFFRIPVVAVIKVAKGSLKVGDPIWIKGHTTDLKQTVASMQVNHQPIQQARKGDEVGLKISGRARRGDRVYRL